MSGKNFFLKAGKCKWSSCFFCGYGRIQGYVPDFDSLKKEFDLFFNSLRSKEVKVFGSGSFLDEYQVPKDARRYFIEKCKKEGIKRLIIESRPEFVTKERLREFRGIDLEIAIGLEVADNRVLDKLNKGFHLEDFEQAVKIIHSSGFKLRTYLLVNPPFVENIEKSLKKSVEYALKFLDSIVLINLLPHYNSPLFELWLRGEWNFLSRGEFLQVAEKFKSDRVELDPETFHFVPKFPKRLQKKLSGVGEEYLTHPYFEVWQDYLQRWYSPPRENDILVFLPCSYKKPYSQSKTHRGIIRVLESVGFKKRIHEVMLSNAGVVPREFESYYPFQSYDWNEEMETEEIKRRYMEVTKERIMRYIKAHGDHYKEVLCFLKHDSESYLVLKEVCEEMKIDCRNLLSRETYLRIRGKKMPLRQDIALGDLYKNLKGIER